MNTAAAKEVKRHEFTATSFTQPDEHILCAVIIGPDRDFPEHKTLHLRTVAGAIEVLQALPLETRVMIAQHFDRLLGEFRKMVTG